MLNQRQCEMPPVIRERIADEIGNTNYTSLSSASIDTANLCKHR